MSGADHRFDKELRELPLDPAGRCPDPAELVAFYEGRFEESAADAIREHIVLCRTCLDNARDARTFVAALAADPAEPKGRSHLRWLAAAAALVGMSLVGLYVVRGRTARVAMAPFDVVVVAAPYLPEDGTTAGPELVWRGAGDTPQFAAAMAPYVHGDYPAAQAALESYLLHQPDDDRARFYLAVTRLLRGAGDDARRDLEQLARITTDPLRGEVIWYLAIASIKTGQAAQAESILHQLARDPNPHRAEAQRLLAALAPTAP